MSSEWIDEKEITPTRLLSSSELMLTVITRCETEISLNSAI